MSEMFVFILEQKADEIYFPVRSKIYSGPSEWTSENEDYFQILWGEEGGAYSKLKYSKKTGEITIDTDITGQLALRYIVTKDATIVASHDIAFAPYVPFLPDEESLRNIHKIGWSVGGHSLISGINVCRPGTRTSINKDVSEIYLEKPKVSDPVSEMLEYMSNHLSKGRVDVELSAGFDSRAALAATLACKNATEIDVFSEGPEDSADVQVAAEICRRAGLRFKHVITEQQPVDVVLDTWSRAAELNNGHIEIDVLASYREKSFGESVTVCGDGGEIFRGYYYPYSLLGHTLGVKVPSAESALVRKLGESTRLLESISRIRKYSKKEKEILDKFYIEERFGVWNQKLARVPNFRLSPFYSRSAMSHVGEGEYPSVHLSLINNYLPSSLDVLINSQLTPKELQYRSPFSIILDSRLFFSKVRNRIIRMQDLKSSRERALSSVLRAVDEDFLFKNAETWADYGAQRFLKIYREKSIIAGRNGFGSS